MQVAAGARVTPEQVSAWIVNSAAFTPPSELVNAPDGALPLLVTVNWMNPDVPPGDMAPKSCVEGVIRKVTAAALPDTAAGLAAAVGLTPAVELAAVGAPGPVLAPADVGVALLGPGVVQLVAATARQSIRNARDGRPIGTRFCMTGLSCLRRDAKVLPTTI